MPSGRGGVCSLCAASRACGPARRALSMLSDSDSVCLSVAAEASANSSLIRRHTSPLSRRRDGPPSPHATRPHRDARQDVRVRSVPVRERVGVPHAAEPAGRHLRPKSSKQRCYRSAARDRPCHSRRAHRPPAHAAVQPAAWRRLRAEQPHRARHLRRPLLLGSPRVDLQLRHRLPGAFHLCTSTAVHLCASTPL